jgi:DNA/RNA endonuclease G (NUC1)
MSDDQGIAFIMYNRAENDNMQKCAISIDMLESLSGIDLFKDLDNSREARLESSFDLKYWGL